MNKEKMKSSLKGLAKSIGNAALTAFLVWLSEFTTGCTTVVVPTDDSNVPAVTVTGAIPFGVQFNTKSENK